MNKTLALWLCGSLLVIASQLFAATQKVGNYTWTYQVKGDGAEICGISSGYVTITIKKRPLTLEEVLDIETDESVTLTTSKANPWTPILDSSANVGDSSARSGVIGNGTNTWICASVSGAGTMSFWYKSSCEHDEDNAYTWDRMMVLTNNVEIVDWRIDGETDWTKRTIC